MPGRPPIINVMAKAATKAARGLVRDFGEVDQLQVSRKGPADFVSAADLRAERTLKTELGRAHRDYIFVGEEGGEDRAGGEDQPRWLVDPLDGTTNFLHGIPHFAISIALQTDGDIVAGIVYEPIRDELFWSVKGGGAYVNDRRLRVSARRNLADSVIGTGIPFLGRGDHAQYLTLLGVVMAQSAGIRRLGAASLDLAYVAAGRLDGFFELGLSPWDMAAGILLVREAGGFVSELGGGRDVLQSGDILAANDHLHLPLGGMLREALKKAAAR